MIELAMNEDAARDAVVGMLASYGGLAIGVSLLVSGLKALWRGWVDGKEPVLTFILTYLLGMAAKLVMPDVYGPDTLQSWALHFVVLLFVAVLAGGFHDKVTNAITGKAGKSAALLLACLAPALCSGCVNAAYVEADEATYKAVAPEYIQLVDGAIETNAAGQPVLGPDGKPKPKYAQDEKDRRKRTVETWRLRIDKNK